MTTVEIELSEDLARAARAAGLLSTEAMESLLREQLRQRAAAGLHAFWQRLPAGELSPDIAQEIDDAVHERRTGERATPE